MTDAEMLTAMRVRLWLMVGRWRTEADFWSQRSDATTDSAAMRSRSYRETAEALASLLDEMEAKR